MVFPCGAIPNTLRQSAWRCGRQPGALGIAPGCRLRAALTAVSKLDVRDENKRLSVGRQIGDFMLLFFLMSVAGLEPKICVN